MSRSGYIDDCDDDLQLGRWRGQVMSAIRGKRGQAFLRELATALDAMPEKRLIKNELVEAGQYCTLGVIGAQRGVKLDALDPYDFEGIADTLGIAHQLVQEIEYENDEGTWQRNETPEDRWKRMRAWVEGTLKSTESRYEAKGKE